MASLGLPVERVIVFGSRARDEHLEWSDYDVAVVSPAFAAMPAIERMTAILRGWRGHRGLDAIGLTPGEYAQGDAPVLDAIRREGRVVWPVAGSGCLRPFAAGTMLTVGTLDEAVSRLARALRPRRIVLFGSRARGEARADSDYDVAVIAESDAPWWEREQRAYRALRGLGLPIEVVVLTPSEIEDERAIPGSLADVLEREGRVLFHAEDAG